MAPQPQPEHPNIIAAKIIANGLDGIATELQEANFHRSEMKPIVKEYYRATSELRREQEQTLLGSTHPLTDNKPSFHKFL